MNGLAWHTDFQPEIPTPKRQGPNARSCPWKRPTRLRSVPRQLPTPPSVSLSLSLSLFLSLSFFRATEAHHLTTEGIHHSPHGWRLTWSKSSYSFALNCTTSRCIPASDSTNQGLLKRRFDFALRAGSFTSRGACPRAWSGKGGSRGGGKPCTP